MKLQRNIGIIVLMIIVCGCFATSNGENSKVDSPNIITNNQPLKVIQVAKNDEHIKKKTKYIKISSISKGMIDNYVYVKGEISSRRDHQDGHVFVTIRDKTGSIEVVIFRDKDVNTQNMEVGNTLAINGLVNIYREKLQLLLDSESDVINIDIVDNGERSTTAADNTIHGNTGSMKFHNSNCEYYNCANCTAIFNSKKEALAAGYVPCKICN